MPDDDKPRSKYECLVEAAANSGLADLLPPIKPGTHVLEISQPPEFMDGSLFQYEGVAGDTYVVHATNWLSKSPDRSIVTKDIAIFTSPPKETLGKFTAQAAHDLKTNEVRVGTHGERPPKAGTIIETTDKFLACRDPKIS
jgi:hypothetical protein